jgi:hypothetical protein
MKPKLIVQAGAQLDSWGTPAWLLDCVRSTFGGIDRDLASNSEANKLVRAKHYYSLKHPCPDIVPASRGKVVWCNPPGPVEKVRWFWSRWLMHIELGWSGAFLIFNLDHLRLLPALSTFILPRDLYFEVPPKRLRFVGAPSQYNHPSGLVSTARLSGVGGNCMRWTR